ncbi:MAG: PxKF domain-containing protein [Actinobacteria bacterium]|nr:PxKF domain-containing protein [Actinomycetota bacterium]
MNADFSCSDPSGVSQCIGTVDRGAAIDTSTAGTHAFQVSTLDNVGNAGTQSASYTVLAGNASATVTDGGTVTTDPGNVGASADVPVQTSITAPASVSGTLTVTLQTATTDPTGFSLFDKEVVLDGPLATATSPYQVTFTVDASLLGDVAPADVQIFRNGTLVADCADATAAIPDPCVASRSTGAGGDATITVRTSAFSIWSVGALRYSVSAFAAPIVAPPSVNMSTAGVSVPLRFSLGGNRGLSVFASGYPRSAAYRCGGTLPTPSVGTATSGMLTYDATNNTYAYVWKTTKTMKGCRQVALRFKDGTLRTVLFNFK